jgi:drug/metabolite transporter (DMT)-like permease
VGEGGERVPLRVHGALLVVQVLFATNAVVAKIALAYMGPRGVLAVRVPTATALFLVLRLAISARRGWQPIERGDVMRLGLLGLLGVALNQLLFFEGLARTTATNSAVLNSTIPVFTAGFAILLGHERATRRRVAGLCVALAGALLIALLGRPDLDRVRLSVGPGEVCLIANSAAYALYLVLSRPLFRRYRTDTAITWIFFTGTLVLLPLGATDVVRYVPTASLGVDLSLAFIVLGPTVGAYFLNGFALATAPSSLVAAYIYLQPVIAAAVAYRYLDERIGLVTVAGAILIGVGIALVSYAGRATRAT